MTVPATPPADASHPRRRDAKVVVRWLYEGDGRTPNLFRFALVTFDVLTVAWVVVSSFLP